MSKHDDFDIEITENEDSELSEKEYSDILGLEGMQVVAKLLWKKNQRKKKKRIHCQKNNNKHNWKN